MAQLVERVLGKDEVPGSNPGSSSKKSCTKVRDFLLIPSYLFTLTSNGRIFLEVIGKREEVKSEVAFLPAVEKHFYYKG